MTVEIKPNELFEAKFSKEGRRILVYSRGFSVEEARRIQSIEIEIGNEKMKGTFLEERKCQN